jgi:hypothetical protein
MAIGVFWNLSSLGIHVVTQNWMRYFSYVFI